MEQSHKAVSRHMVGKWYFRERIRKPEVQVKAHQLSGKHPKGDSNRKLGKLQTSTGVQ